MSYLQVLQKFSNKRFPVDTLHQIMYKQLYNSKTTIRK